MEFLSLGNIGSGRRYDAESGLYYYRNRMYNAELRRFIQRDPKGYVDGTNLYAFVKNNPLRYLDAMGTTVRPVTTNNDLNMLMYADSQPKDFENGPLLASNDIENNFSKQHKKGNAEILTK